MSDEVQRIEVRRVREGRAIRLVLNGGGGVQAKSKVTPAEAHRVADDLREAAEAAMDAGDDLWEEMTGERPARSAAPEPDDPEGLVEAAFREGFAAGYESGMDDAHYHSPAGEGVEDAWAESDARDRLQAQEAGDGAD